MANHISMICVWCLLTIHSNTGFSWNQNCAVANKITCYILWQVENQKGKQNGKEKSTPPPKKKAKEDTNQLTRHTPPWKSKQKKNV